MGSRHRAEVHAGRSSAVGRQRAMAARTLSLVLVVAGGWLGASGCSALSHRKPQNSSCAPPAYELQAGTVSAGNGSCAGRLSPPTQVTVQVGERFTVKVSAEADGTLDYPAPVPANANVRLLGHKGAVFAFRAVSRGEVDLRAVGTLFCPGANRQLSACTVLAVQVK